MEHMNQCIGQIGQPIGKLECYKHIKKYKIYIEHQPLMNYRVGGIRVRGPDALPSLSNPVYNFVLYCVYEEGDVVVP